MIAVLKSYIMEGWFYPKSRKKRKRKKDDFWSDYLRRNYSDNDKIKIVRNRREAKCLTMCPNAGGHHQTISGRDGDVITGNTSDRSQYQSNVFNKIFGKKFEGKTVRTLRRLSSQPEAETYHFCLK